MVEEARNVRVDPETDVLGEIGAAELICATDTAETRTMSPTQPIKNNLIASLRLRFY
jgi:hypothetical protein